MNESTPNPQEAADLLVRGSRLSAAVGDADTGRQKIYLLWAAVVPLGMIWFDILGGGAGALAMQPFVIAGVVGTLLVVRQQQVTDMAAMKGYFVVMGMFALMWPVLVWLVGPWMADRISIGWTITGLIGGAIFLAGYFWDRSRR